MKDEKYSEMVSGLLSRDLENKRSIVLNTIGEAAAYEQLAEECSELCKAALKKVRYLCDENPTPLTIQEIDSSVIEELTDIKLVLNTIGIRPNDQIYIQKLNRWANRVQGGLNEDHTS